ncbi:glycerol-3-phosphate dehydrogenase subunit GlpB [Halocatena halophila]|uniref:glycerol-3-phosphate dehydrogenase subunit GlpB n=1 Tax=Halocatena halophila TaxID=2814576 RepID=UPI002ED032BC
MAIESDVCVIGGGLAGMTSALAAAETGASVRLLSHKKSTLRQASGLIDVLGYTPAGEIVAEPFEAMGSLPNHHLYQRVGSQAIHDGLALFDRVVGESYAGGHTSANALVPTYVGRIKPTARYPAMTAAGLASDRSPVLFVGFERLSAFDAPYVSASLSSDGMPAPTRGVTISAPGSHRPDTRLHRLVHALDANESVSTSTGEQPIRIALARRIESHLESAQRVGLPALLGLENAPNVRRDLEQFLGVDVFEVPMGPPSIPGQRLEHQFLDALDRAGVHRATGNPVVAFDADGDRIRRVFTDRNGSSVPYEATQFVLATGGLVGKGLDSDRTALTESVFDCHVPHPEDRTEWYGDNPHTDQPFARFGVSVDADLKPHDDSGSPEYDNLRAAGAILGGTDVTMELSASGNSLTSGVRAGRLAGERSN